MFTGIIEELGILTKLTHGAYAAHMRIGCKKVLEGSVQGDSIAVMGVCLTITDLGSDYFCCDCMHETLKRSSLDQLTVGKKLHLERALTLSGRFGGHIVSGHIDGVARLLKRERDGISWMLRFVCPDLVEGMVPKGSIAIDGVSLTLAALHKDGFSVGIIPHTQAQTLLLELRPGDLVNIELDMLGKYVNAWMERHAHDKAEIAFTKASSREASFTQPPFAGASFSSHLSQETLAQNGFL